MSNRNISSCDSIDLLDNSVIKEMKKGYTKLKFAVMTLPVSLPLSAFESGTVSSLAVLFRRLGHFQKVCNFYTSYSNTLIFLWHTCSDWKSELKDDTWNLYTLGSSSSSANGIDLFSFRFLIHSFFPGSCYLCHQHYFGGHLS